MTTHDLPCPVEADFLGIQLGACGEPTTRMVTRHCTNGHTATRPMCDTHIELLVDNGVGPVDCATCADAGIHEVPTELIAEERHGNPARAAEIAQGGDGRE